MQPCWTCQWWFKPFERNSSVEIVRSIILHSIVCSVNKDLTSGTHNVPGHGFLCRMYKSTVLQCSRFLCTNQCLHTFFSWFVFLRSRSCPRTLIPSSTGSSSRIDPWRRFPHVKAEWYYPLSWVEKMQGKRQIQITTIRLSGRSYRTVLIFHKTKPVLRKLTTCGEHFSCGIDTCGQTHIGKLLRVKIFIEAIPSMRICNCLLKWRGRCQCGSMYVSVTASITLRRD